MANPNPKIENLRPKPWQPGQSGNPKGRPKKPSMKAALDAAIDAKPEILQALISKGIQEALKGDFRYWREIFERLDGKVPTLVEVEAKPAIDWSEIDVECDTPPRNHAIDTQGLHPLPEGGETGI